MHLLGSPISSSRIREMLKSKPIKLSSLTDRFTDRRHREDPPLIDHRYQHRGHIPVQILWWPRYREESPGTNQMHSAADWVESSTMLPRMSNLGFTSKPKLARAGMAVWMASMTLCKFPAIVPASGYHLWCAPFGEYRWAVWIPLLPLTEVDDLSCKQMFGGSKRGTMSLGPLFNLGQFLNNCPNIWRSIS